MSFFHTAVSGASLGSRSRRSSAFYNEVETGKSVQDVCREHGMSDATFYNWRAKYGDTEVSVGQAPEGHRRTKALRPAEKRTLVDYAVDEHEALLALAEWAETNGVRLEFIKPGKPTRNSHVERFNRTYREEILDAYIFQSLDEVRELTRTWIDQYNGERPHTALGRITPLDYRRANGRADTKLSPAQKA